MTETALVTGGSGFVAGWCIAELLDRGYLVRTTVRSATPGQAVMQSLTQSGRDTAGVALFEADLTADKGWNEAVAGCDLVLHVASPLGGAGGDLIAPARDGTIRVLRAAASTRVRRVVVTSAAATARPPQGDLRVSDETIWADPDDPQFDDYRRSKILAERAAWEFAANNPALEVTAILPGAVYGPLLAGMSTGGVRLVAQLLDGRPPALLPLGFWITDVRDLACAHIDALVRPGAAGERFIVAGEFQWFEEIARTLREHFGQRAARVPSTVLDLERASALAEKIPELQGLVPMFGRENALTSAKARAALGYAPRPARTTIIECAESLLARP